MNIIYYEGRIYYDPYSINQVHDNIAFLYGIRPDSCLKLIWNKGGNFCGIENLKPSNVYEENKKFGLDLMPKVNKSDLDSIERILSKMDRQGYHKAVEEQTKSKENYHRYKYVLATLSIMRWDFSENFPEKNRRPITNPKGIDNRTQAEKDWDEDIANLNYACMFRDRNGFSLADKMFDISLNNPEYIKYSDNLEERKVG